MTRTIQFESWTHPVPLTISDNLPIEVTEKALLDFTAFKNWISALRTNLERQATPGHTFEFDPWVLAELKVHSIHMFQTKDGPRPGFMTVEAILHRNEEPKVLDRVVFLRGGSVAVLMILRPKDSRNERYVILTDQPRIGACSTNFLEIPAGMLDDSDEIKGKAIQEIEEETNLTVRKEELIDLTALALEGERQDEDLQNGIYMSPANLDEFIPLFLWEKDLDRKEIEALKGRLTGERTSDETITLRIIAYEELWKIGARDAKTLASWALYEGLNGAGKIEEKLHEIRIGRFG
ncbi:nudix hydrolase 14 [Lophiostoma macrostomum CBS 122681]|uniref:Nudix hydrolase 14 n=1 Tax=Lophiostoma macrostomum CBS 122681 TaxID=1314788 RepID=A0A6A6T8E9_9PLEO|nr:nudix hydrolase 14 [Lophiostoma macrostomum CBS 122681]